MTGVPTGVASPFTASAATPAAPAAPVAVGTCPVCGRGRLPLTAGRKVLAHPDAAGPHIRAKRDPATGKPLLDKDGRPVPERHTPRCPGTGQAARRPGRPKAATP